MVSYNDTPVKEPHGSTVISTDFSKLGETADHMIRNKKFELVKSPWDPINRRSLLLKVCHFEQDSTG